MSRATLSPSTSVSHATRPTSIDDKVPIQQSKDVVEALEAKGLDVEFEILEGADHLFDMSPEVTLDRMYAFVKRVTA